MLTKVTITGADDNTNVKNLVELSKEFPFVEWGILFSQSRHGTNRYPSMLWIQSLPECLTLSAHLCGQYACDVMNGIDDLIALYIHNKFKRLQINGFHLQHNKLTDIELPYFKLTSLAKKYSDIEFILQVQDEWKLQDTANVINNIGNASILYDPSGGQGINPFRWPIAPFGIKLGYAGGIKPSNVVDTLNDIGIVDHDFWIDMESGVRTNDTFDYDLAHKILTLTKPLIIMK